MKVLLYNLNIGSGVEYVGNVIAQWCKEIEGLEFYEHKIQDPPCLTVNSIVKYQPDVIIINDNCPRVYEGPYYYKRFFPEKKIIYLTHGIKELLPIQKSGNMFHNYDRILLYIGARDYFDYIISFNPIDIPDHLVSKTLHGCFPVDPNEYKITTPWNERKKNFCYVGQINDLKFSLEFLKELKNYDDIIIDCYGNIHDQYINKEYKEALAIKQINYLGFLKQDQVSKILNEYKFYILPHGRVPEIFNITLLQSMFCGTIPLVCNDRKANFNYQWIDWAKGLYTPHDKEWQLLKTMSSQTVINGEYSNISMTISKEAQEKFNYNKFKNEFQQLLKGYINEY
jgi:hypothetical protein